MTERRRATSAAPKKDPTTNRWGFVVDVGLGPGGQRRQVRRRGFATKKEAQAELDRLRTEGREGTYVTPANMTVGDYLSAWVDALPMRGLKPSTVESYRRNVDHYVVPRIGGRRLDRLRASDLDALYADLLTAGRRRREGGLSCRSVRYVHAIVRRAFADAVKKGELRHNPAVASSPPSAKSARPPEQRWWTPAQIATFLAATADDPLGPLFRLAAMTGMRRGEVCGLRWDDVDLETGTVDVHRQLSVIAGQVVRSDDLKTAQARRRLAVDPATVDALRAHRQRQAAQRLVAGVDWTDEGWIFTGPAGAAHHPESVAKMFERRAAKAGLPVIRFHDLRHSHTAALIAAGRSALDIAKRLGHASPAFSMSQYGHLLDTAGIEAANAVAELIARAS